MPIKPSATNCDKHTSMVNRHIGSAYTTVKIVADNIDIIEDIGENLPYLLKYLGVYSTPPTERPDGSPLQDGDYYFDSVAEALIYYKLSTDEWFEVDPQEILNARDEAIAARDAAQLAQANAETAEANAADSAAAAENAQGALVNVATVTDLSNTTYPLGTRVKLLDRLGAEFVIASSGATDGFSTLPTGNTNIAVIQPIGAMDLRAFGAVSDGIFNNTPVLESASQYTNVIIIDAPIGENFYFSTVPVVGAITCLVSRSDIITNISLTNIKGVSLDSGIISGYVNTPELIGKNIEVVAGSIRQNAGFLPYWNFIKDANHEPIGVDDSQPCIATGSSIVVPFTKTYTRVLSLVTGPDETLANMYQLSVGSSVGLDRITIKASANLEISSLIRYEGAGVWTFDNRGNVGVSGVSHDNVNGVTTITHGPVPGLSVSLTPSTESVAPSLVPYLPLLGGTDRTFSANYATAIKYVDLATPTEYKLVENAPMCFTFSKTYSQGIFLDGTNGFDELNLSLGNLWFFGIFEV